MSALLAWVLSNPTILAIGGAIIMATGAWFKGRLSGAKAERNKQALEEVKARDVADQVQNDVGAMHPDAARSELNRWSKG